MNSMEIISEKIIWYNGVKCQIRFGNYIDGSIRMYLVEKNTKNNVTTCTVNMFLDGVKVSKLNKEVLIKSWGTNEGLYEVLRDHNIISRTKKTKSVGLNEAYYCDLLIDPINYK